MEQGLRDRKKRQTRRQLADTALRLFLEHGFDAVSVNDVAAAAQVSKPTLFRYFASKEDLLLDRFADHEDEAARIVTARPAGQSPLRALHEHFRTALRAYDPITGLNDHPEVLAFQELLFGTPSLVSRMARYTEREVEHLTTALRPTAATDLDARLTALYLVTIRHELGRENNRRLAAGATAAATLAEALADADRAFGALATGLDAQEAASGS
ncbi:TetR family transcriptional regulator [Kitasatospora nipponensis]|uniref:TetR family transcriptional regulator n=1 Tax=Kitasatospora nipponensis TaxID=258049 RepID=A0ABN1W376_9ACTN